MLSRSFAFLLLLLLLLPLAGLFVRLVGPTRLDSEPYRGASDNLCTSTAVFGVSDLTCGGGRVVQAVLAGVDVFAGTTAEGRFLMAVSNLNHPPHSSRSPSLKPLRCSWLKIPPRTSLDCFVGALPDPPMETSRSMPFHSHERSGEACKSAETYAISSSSRVSEPRRADSSEGERGRGNVVGGVL